MIMAALPGLHPGDHDPASVRRQQGLRRIKVEAVIDRMNSFSGKLICLPVKRSDHINIPESIVIGSAAGKHLLRRSDQDCMVLVHHEEIRALPHTAVFIAAPVQNRLHLPVQSILAAVEKDRAAAIHRAVCHNGVKAVFPVIIPYFGIAEIHRAPPLRQVRRSEHRVIFIFYIIHSVAEGHALHLTALDIAVLPLPFLDTGIHQSLTPVRHLYGTARKTPGIIILFIRCDRRRKPLPAHQVPGLDMSPVHRTPLCIVGIILIKKMVFALIYGKTVGVIHPADTRNNMKKRPVTV